VYDVVTEAIVKSFIDFLVIVLGGTSYSLVQLFLLSDVSFSHNTPSHFVTVVQTDDSIMTITDRPTKLAWRCKHALEKDNNKYCANTPRLFARCCTFKIVFSYSAIQPQVCLIIIIIIIIRWANYTSSSCKFPMLYICQKLWKLAEFRQSYCNEHVCSFLAHPVQVTTLRGRGRDSDRPTFEA